MQTEKTDERNQPERSSPISRRTLLRTGAVGVGTAAIGIGAFSSTAVAHGACARTPGYWKNHFDDWPTDDGFLITHEDRVTNQQALDILTTSPRGDKTIIMAQHLTATRLNVLNGTVDRCVVGDGGPDDPIYAARVFLGDYFDIDSVSGTKKWHGYEWAKDALDAYNNGRLCACKSD